MVETLDQDILVNQIIAMAENGVIINWSNSLVILSSTIAFRSDIRSKLHSVLEDKLIQYMDSDSEKFISILLLARQASLEPQGKFGTYTKFYK